MWFPGFFLHDLTFPYPRSGCFVRSNVDVSAQVPNAKLNTPRSGIRAIIYNTATLSRFKKEILLRTRRVIFANVTVVLGFLHARSHVFCTDIVLSLRNCQIHSFPHTWRNWVQGPKIVILCIEKFTRHWNNSFFCWGIFPCEPAKYFCFNSTLLVRWDKSYFVVSSRPIDHRIIRGNVFEVLWTEIRKTWIQWILPLSTEKNATE